MRKFVYAALAAFAVMSSPAASMEICFPKEKLPSVLNKIHAAPLFLGISNSGIGYMILVDDSTGSWGAFEIRKDGNICYLVEGKQFRLSVPANPKPGDAAK